MCWAPERKLLYGTLVCIHLFIQHAKWFFFWDSRCMMLPNFWRSTQEEMKYSCQQQVCWLGLWIFRAVSYNMMLAQSYIVVVFSCPFLLRQVQIVTLVGSWRELPSSLAWFPLIEGCVAWGQGRMQLMTLRMLATAAVPEIWCRTTMWVMLTLPRFHQNQHLLQPNSLPTTLTRALNSSSRSCSSLCPLLF